MSASRPTTVTDDAAAVLAPKLNTPLQSASIWCVLARLGSPQPTRNCYDILSLVDQLNGSHRKSVASLG
jgi:hypothetical protein